MRIGLSSWACAWSIGVPGYALPEPLSACGLIRKAAGYGLDLVQIADNIALENFAQGDLRELANCANEHGVRLELGTRGIDRQHLLRFLDLCRFFGSNILRIVVDARGLEPSPDEVIDAARAVLPELSAAGVTLAIENHDRFTAETIADIVSRIGSTCVGVCLDTVNSFGALEGPEVVVRTLAPYVVNLHVKDFVVRRHPHMMGFEILGAPCGQGRLDVPWLLTELRDHGRDPNAILELWPPALKTAAESAEVEERWRRESIDYLKRVLVR